MGRLALTIAIFAPLAALVVLPSLLYPGPMGGFPAEPIRVLAMFGVYALVREAWVFAGGLLYG